MIRVGWKNLVGDRSRMAISLLGVMVAVILMLIQSGIYLGFVSSASAVIDHCSADLWIVPKETVNFESAGPFPERDLLAVKGTPGVAWVHPLIHTFGYLKLPDGAGRWAQIIGFDAASGVGGPWDMVQGRFSDLGKPGAYIVDESSLSQLQGLGLGDTLENFDQRMEIVGICRGAKTYTTYPILFTSFRTAQRQTPMFDDWTNFMVAKVDRGASPEDVMDRLDRLERFDVYSRQQFSQKTRTYWATRTGVGIGIGLTILLGFLVGLVIVGQTMYASTVEKIREYATLKALGATRLQVGSVIWTQAVILGVAGYGVGSAVACLARMAYSGEAVAVRFTPGQFAVMFAATMAMCLGASMISVGRVQRVAPATVFRS
jgi:putative ABC transport system permease protein